MSIKPIRVTQLNGYIKRILQSDPLLGNVSVIGEISNLKHHGTGHIYFTLKDETSKINCFLGAETLKDIRYELADGMEIIIYGYIYLYERGGTYSLNVRDIAIEGVGNLSTAFEKLKEKLSKEGLFDEKYKKPIPFFPHKIAVITSETGAAVRDIIKIIKSRNNIVDILVYPCLVQGTEAAKEISSAIDEVNRLYPEVDTIITGRGGGSMEELWAFNEEIVARSIFASKIPIISAVGHETDFTIADFVADKRAETPTAAAQMAVPDVGVLKENIKYGRDNLKHSLERYLKYMELKLASNNVESLSTSLKNRINLNTMKTDSLYENLENILNQKISAYNSYLDGLKAELEALSPNNIMKKGYAAIVDSNGNLAVTVKGFSIGDKLTAVLSDGELACQIKEVRRANHDKFKKENQL